MTTKKREYDVAEYQKKARRAIVRSWHDEHHAGRFEDCPLSRCVGHNAPNG